MPCVFVHGEVYSGVTDFAKNEQMPVKGFANNVQKGVAGKVLGGFDKKMCNMGVAGVVGSHFCAILQLFLYVLGCAWAFMDCSWNVPSAPGCSWIVFLCTVAMFLLVLGSTFEVRGFLMDCPWMFLDCGFVLQGTPTNMQHHSQTCTKM